MYTREEAEEVKRLCKIPANKQSWEESKKLELFMTKYPEAFEMILDKISREAENNQ